MLAAHFCKSKSHVVGCLALDFRQARLGGKPKRLDTHGKRKVRLSNVHNKALTRTFFATRLDVPGRARSAPSAPEPKHAPGPKPLPRKRPNPLPCKQYPYASGPRRLRVARYTGAWRSRNNCCHRMPVPLHGSRGRRFGMAPEKKLQLNWLTTLEAWCGAGSVRLGS